MRLGQAQPTAVPILESAGPRLFRKTGLFQHHELHPVRGIDGGRITQRRCPLLQEARQPGRDVRQEHLVNLRSVVMVARSARQCNSVTVSQCQFAHSVGAAAVARMHVFYLQRDVGRVAIGAGAPKHAARPTDGILTSDPGADNRRHGSPLRTVLPTAVALRRRPPHATAPSQALFQWQPTWPNDDYQSALPVCRRWPTSSSFRRSNRHTKPDGCAVRGLLPPP